MTDRYVARFIVIGCWVYLQKLIDFAVSLGTHLIQRVLPGKYVPGFIVICSDKNVPRFIVIGCRLGERIKCIFAGTKQADQVPIHLNCEYGLAQLGPKGDTVCLLNQTQTAKGAKKRERKISPDVESIKYLASVLPTIFARSITATVVCNLITKCCQSAADNKMLSTSG